MTYIKLFNGEYYTRIIRSIRGSFNKGKITGKKSLVAIAHSRTYFEESVINIEYFLQTPNLVLCHKPIKSAAF